MSDYLLQLAEISVTVSAVGVIFIILSPIMNRKFSLSWKRWVWLLLGIRLIFPFSFALPEAPVVVEVPELNTVIREPVRDDLTIAPVIRSQIFENKQQAGSRIDFVLFLAGMWAAGLVVLLAYNLMRSYSFRRKVLRWSLPADEELAALCNMLKSRMSIQKGPEVRISRQVSSPMLMGIVRPVILLPSRQYDMSNAELIICHELIHYKRKDIWFKLIMQIARAMHWFNPVVYLMAQQSERDIELACDEKVLKVTGGNNRRQYGSMIISGAEEAVMKASVLTTQFNPGKRILTERITNIMTKNKRRGGFIFLSLAAAAIILCGTLVVFTSKKMESDGQSQNSYAQSEYSELLTLRPDSYKAMTIAQFRQMVFDSIEEQEEKVHQLIDREDQQLEQQRYTDPDASFILNTLIPLIADNWQTRYYAAGWEEADIITEVSLTRIIEDENKLTVGEHEQLVLEALNAAEEWLRDADTEELKDSNKREEAMDQIAERYSNAAVQFGISSWYSGGEFDDSELDDSESMQEASGQDYTDLLELRYTGYEDMTVQEYQELVQKAFSSSEELDSAYARVLMAFGGSLPDGLAEDEQRFLTLTLYATVADYSAEQQSQYSNYRKWPQFNFVFNGDLLENDVVFISYDIEFLVLNPDQLTVQARDQQISRVMNDIEQYLSGQSDNFWKDNEETIAKYMEQACEKYSNENIELKADIFMYESL